MGAVKDSSHTSVLPRTTLVPLLCAAHCLAAPALVVVAPLLAENEALEWAGFSLAVVVAVYVLSSGLRVHQQWSVLAPIAGGLLLWLSGLLELFAAPEWLVTTTGALVLAAGIFWDARLRRHTTCPA
jgi:hypothetical protein